MSPPKYSYPIVLSSHLHSITSKYHQISPKPHEMSGRKGKKIGVSEWAYFVFKDATKRLYIWNALLAGSHDGHTDKEEIV